MENSNANASAMKVREVLAEHLGVNLMDVIPEAKLVNDLGADSLDAVEVVMAVEEAFSIEIGDDEAEKLVTVQDFIDIVGQKKK